MKMELLFVLGVLIAGGKVGVARGATEQEPRTVPVYAEGVAGDPVLESLTPRIAALLGTNSQTCNGITAGDCTISLTVALVGVGPDGGCFKVKLSGTITCGTTSCTFDREVCGDQAASETFACGGKDFEISTTAQEWGAVARGAVPCTKVSARIV